MHEKSLIIQIWVPIKSVCTNFSTVECWVIFFVCYKWKSYESRMEISSVELYTIDCEYLTYLSKFYGLRTPRESFFQKSWTLLLGLDKHFGLKFFETFGVFLAGLHISTHFGTVSSLPVFFIIQPLLLQKTKPLHPASNYLFGSWIWIWAPKNLRLGICASVVRVCNYI